MKKIAVILCPVILAGILLFSGLMGVFSMPNPLTTAVPAGIHRTIVAITQDPVEPDDSSIAKLVVEGPTKVRAGDLVVISVEGSRAASFKWIVTPTTDNFLVFDGGKRVVFSSGVAGEYVFTIACGLGDTCDVVRHIVTVVGSNPGPADNLTSKIAFYCDRVKSDTKRDDCIKLAQSFSSVAMVIEGGMLATPKDILQATFKSNQDALGDKLINWLPFRNGLSKELKAMADAGKLPDTAAHITAWKAIAEGLREYAKTL